ncbi:MAG: MarR family winged helix-turn-helix transcriptional regulator [Malacoplasma sp.]|nr:MarR family winged helix-turn-helix transcriptional regulator [Malacoplasma sp.]
MSEIIEKENLWKEIIISFRKLLRNYKKNEYKFIKKWKMSPTKFEILRFLYYRGESLIRTIIEELVTTYGNTNYVLDKLEKQNLIYQKKDSKDKRSFLIGLTFEGNMMMEKVLVEYVSYLENTISKLRKSEKIALIKILKKLDF